jgi:hypothetical protein
MTTSSFVGSLRILPSRGLTALLVTAVAPVGLVLLGACSHPQATPTTPTATTDPNALATAPTVAPTTTVTTTDPNAVATAPTGTVAPTATTTGTASVSNVVSTVSQAALDLLIQTAAKKDAPGMTAEGAAITGSLTEGQHTDGLVTLAPGKCYTIIAAGTLNSLTRVDLTLLAPPLFNVNAGQDSGGINAVAVIGKGSKALCPMIMFPVSYKVDVAAHKGAGDVRAQLFSKTK